MRDCWDDSGAVGAAGSSGGGCAVVVTGQSGGCEHAIDGLPGVCALGQPQAKVMI